MLTRYDIEMIINWVNALPVHICSSLEYQKTGWMLIVEHVIWYRYAFRHKAGGIFVGF